MMHQTEEQQKKKKRLGFVGEISIVGGEYQTKTHFFLIRIHQSEKYTVGRAKQVDLRSEH